MTTPFLTGYLALGSGTSATAFVELSGSGYSRQAVTLMQVSPGQVVVTPGVSFGPATAAWATATQHAIYDGSGNEIFVWMVRSPYAVASGATHSIAAAAIAIAIYDLASPAAEAGNNAVVWPSGASIGVILTNGQPVVAGSSLQVIDGVCSAAAGGAVVVDGTSIVNSGGTLSIGIVPAADLSGVVPPANLGTGTASSSTALFGDGTYKTLTGGGTLTGLTAAGAAVSGGGTSGSITLSVLGVPSGFINPRDPAYGAKCNGKSITGVTTTASSAVVSSTAYSFVSGDVGKLIAIPGAVSVVSGSNPLGTLNATISSVSGGNATLSASATVSIAGTGTAIFGTNDTTALQAAINAANTAGGGTLFLDGMAIINASLTWYSQVSMTGRGAGKSILKWISTSDIPGAMIQALSGSASAPYTDCQFTNFEIDADAATLATYTVAAKCFYMQWMVRPVFQGLYVHGSPASGIGTDYLQYGNISNNVVINCGRTCVNGTNSGGSGIGIATSASWSEGTVVEGNTVVMPSASFGYYGIFFEDQSSSTLASTDYDQIVANRIFLNGSAQRGIGSEGTNNTLIAGNSVYGSGAASQRGISIAQGTGSLTNPSGNYTKVIANLVSNVDIGLYVLGSSTAEVVPNDILIADNTIESCLRSCIWISTGTIQMDTIKAANNILALSNTSGFLLTGTAGVKNLELRGNVIKNNALTTSTANLKCGVAIQSPVAKLLATDNNIFDNNTGTQLYGFIFDGSITIVTGALITDNDLIGNATGAISITNSATIAGWVYNNPGYNPVGASSVTPGSSPWTYTCGNTPGTLYLTGGTVSSVTKSGITLAAASPCAVQLQPGQAAVITYSAAPTAAFDAL